MSIVDRSPSADHNGRKLNPVKYFSRRVVGPGRFIGNSAMGKYSSGWDLRSVAVVLTSKGLYVDTVYRMKNNAGSSIICSNGTKINVFDSGSVSLQGFVPAHVDQAFRDPPPSLSNLFITIEAFRDR